MLGLQEPKGGFKLYLLSNAEKKWLKALHLPEQVATRATGVGRGEDVELAAGEDGAAGGVEVGRLGVQLGDLELPVFLALTRYCQWHFSQANYGGQKGLLV